jgi:hypothetical protein
VTGYAITKPLEPSSDIHIHRSVSFTAMHYNAVNQTFKEKINLKTNKLVCLH